mmetsp:Transcript_8809/g.22438  ORF Transcript_8809/g.22438 Transcript_8809/m.22438 type:complete len:241 (+) Transcript_8809:1670-2392(+)
MRREGRRGRAERAPSPQPPRPPSQRSARPLTRASRRAMYTPSPPPPVQRIAQFSAYPRGFEVGRQVGANVTPQQQCANPGPWPNYSQQVCAGGTRQNPGTWAHRLSQSCPDSNPVQAPVSARPVSESKCPNFRGPSFGLPVSESQCPTPTRPPPDPQTQTLESRFQKPPWRPFQMPIRKRLHRRWSARIMKLQQPHLRLARVVAFRTSRLLSRRKRRRAVAVPGSFGGTRRPPPRPRAPG